MTADRRRRVVITGIGPVSPIGVGAESFWDAIVAGRSGAVALDQLSIPFAIETLRSRVVARVRDEWLPDDPRRRTDRRGLFAEVALRLALADAGLATLSGSRSAVVVGNAVGAPIEVEATFLQRERAATALHAGDGDSALLRQLSFHTVADELADRCGCEGPVLTISTGCTAALDAISAAYAMIRSGEVELAVTGSAEAPLTPMVLASFDVIGATTRRNDVPQTASRPFDRERDGFVLGEGAAILVVEDAERALGRGARAYAELVGFASTSNGRHMTNMAPDGRAVAHCIRMALEDARVPPDAIDHVNAHGSSTPQNDLCETNAIKEALGRRSHAVTVNSLKSMVGHALGASNALELAGCSLSLRHQRHFPTINLRTPGEGCDLDYVPEGARRAVIGHLLKLSNGFSGIHSAVVMRAA